MSELKVGEVVSAFYKTGKYIGEIKEIRSQSYLVEVLAVLKHPMQGDLHHPKAVEGVFFHERKALSFKEKTNVPKQMAKRFEESIPSYQDSLNAALEKMRQELSEDSSEFAQRSLQNLAIIEKEYSL
ncbi:kinase-associated lipoprotein B [Niallia sp. NCCP-28]|uniref:kinase-associated lipoprotein B n=1 Tax=Niallia sp. NCCP-28 TaxID=2934712 RepID=UPI0020812206|nr:kinase-associated lipoprotein B [Niallia sp. NCCP-28]GKU83163.1 kinase-associated lipoprotein B [Niallia sp. NCCP-28]